MRHYIQITFLSICLLFAAFYGNSQTKNDELSVPLSNPGQPGLLIASAQQGAFIIKGSSGNQVTLRVIEKRGEDDREWKDSENRRGLKKISNTMMDASITEESNTVRVQLNNRSSNVVEILVPRNFSLKIDTHHDGDVTVSNIAGNIEVSAHHGDVSLEKISGSAIVDTHHGEIEAHFDAVDASKPMAFTTYHGDVEIEFPADVNCTTKIKTTKGDVYSDFEMQIKPQKTEIKEKGKQKQIKIGGWIHGEIGRGGEEFMFSTYHGDVIIQKIKA